MKPVPYTQTYAKPALCISTACKISEPYDASMDPGEHPPYIELNAIWDTGAFGGCEVQPNAADSARGVCFPDTRHDALCNRLYVNR